MFTKIKLPDWLQMLAIASVTIVCSGLSLSSALMPVA